MHLLPWTHTQEKQEILVNGMWAFAKNSESEGKTCAFAWSILYIYDESVPRGKLLLGCCKTANLWNGDTSRNQWVGGIPSCWLHERPSARANGFRKSWKVACALSRREHASSATTCFTQSIVVGCYGGKTGVGNEGTVMVCFLIVLHARIDISVRFVFIEFSKKKYSCVCSLN